jgi:hypothetical protein
MPAQIGRILKLDRLRLRGPVARAPLLASGLSLTTESLTTVAYATWPTDGALAKREASRDALQNSTYRAGNLVWLPGDDGHGSNHRPRTERLRVYRSGKPVDGGVGNE